MLKKIKPTTPGTRHQLRLVLDVDAKKPEKSLVRILKKHAGRNSYGRVTVRHRGGGHKRYYRLIDFKRNKYDIPGKVIAFEYDPNRSANIALIQYPDGDKRYILAPDKLKRGDLVLSGEKAPLKDGNALPLARIPVGMPIHNLELKPGAGGKLVRGAGTAAFIQAKEGKYVSVKLPSGEIRLINSRCFATIGQVSNLDHKNQKLGKAGRKRHLGWRPTVRGVAMHPGAHPHGGGEGRSGIGMKSPKTPWGKKALGKKTRKPRKYSNKYIIKDRRIK